MNIVYIERYRLSNKVICIMFFVFCKRGVRAIFGISHVNIVDLLLQVCMIRFYKRRMQRGVVL